jgi:hypothetical protein
MRHLALVFTLASAASAGFLACSSSSGSDDVPDSGASSTPDSGGVGNDAATLDGTSPTHDAAASDGSMLDAAPPDGSDSADGSDGADAVASGAVQVVVVTASGPESGVTVVFSDATGALVATGTTDATGSVTQDVAAGSQVTALFNTSNGPNLVTIVGVKPGDVLKLVDGPVYVNGANVQATIDAFTQGDASVSDYYISSAGCSTDTNGAVGTFEYGLGNGCQNVSGQVPILVQALDSSNNGLAWQAAQGSLLASDAGVASVDLTSTSWTTTFGTQSVTLLNAPDTLEPGVGFTEFTAVDSVSSVAFGLSTFTGQYPDAGVQTFEFNATHPGFAAFDQIEADDTISQSGGASVLAIADRVSTTTLASPSANDTIDLNDVLPTITNATLDATHPTRPSIAWTSAAPLTGAVATVVQVKWSDPLDDAGDVRAGTWTIAVPASQMSVVPPQIPDASGLGPTTMASWSTAFPMVYSMNGDAFPTYDAIRATAALVGPALNVSTSPLLVPALPANGRARVTAFYPF